jgi:class 3 adenylate cyclase
MDVEGWLQRLGMEQYAPAFRDNAIDDEVLPRLNGDDLKEIGVAAVGHRRKLLEAIAALSAVPAPSAAPAPLSPRAKDDAERRPITVMFCDLVGSTSMAAEMEAEDWRELVGGYLDEASNSVTQYGGYVLKKLGDGLMALFGYPKAQENDTERAARAGLAILRALEDLNARNVARGLPALAARIGLQSGPVVVDSSGEVFGDAPNVAARVQAAAEPGTLFVTAFVQRQVAGFFVAEDKGPHDLKGVPGKPVLYRLVRASGGGRKGGARSLTPLIGREEELATLARRWERAKAGDGQLVQIVGEPGLGKSRLVDEFRIRLAETPHTWIEWSSSQLLQNTPLHPLAEWGRQRFVGEARFTELNAALAQVNLDPAEHAPLLATLLDISLPDGRAPQLAADELRRRQLAAVVAWLSAGARAQPLVLAFEDLHWADPTTLDLMKTLTDRGSETPLLIVATARPEFRAPWATRSHHSVISLSPLDREQIGRMVVAIAAHHALSKDLVEGLSDRTAGVPLFIEELTRLMLEGGAQTVPPTLQQSLAARLDRLGTAREVAQIGAVLGREFSHSLLAAVAEMPGSALEAALDKLSETDLLFVDGVAPAAIYRFKHALIQDAAYDSMLRNRRQALHRRAAETLVIASTPQPELIAHHYAEAGAKGEAIEWWGKAGDTALRRSAFQEAISHLGKAVALVEKRDRSSEKQGGGAQASAEIRAKFARATLITHGHSSAEAKAAFDHTDLQNLSELPEVEQLTAINGRVGRALLCGELTLARSVAEVGLREGETAQRRMLVADSHRLISYIDCLLGRPSASLERARFALTLFDEEWADAHRQSVGNDFSCGIHYGSAIAATILGTVDAGAVHAKMARDQATALGQAFTSVNVYSNNLIRLIYLNCPEDTLIEAEALYRLLALHGIRALGDAAILSHAWASGRLIDLDAGIAQLKVTRGETQGRGAGLYECWYLMCLADLSRRAGRPNEALEFADSGIAEATKRSYDLNLAPLHRLRGEALADIDVGAAEDAFRASIDVAREQGARLFELQGALAYGRLLHGTHRPLEARDLLSAALEGFSPTPEVPAFDEAQSLLSSLEALPEATEARSSQRQIAKLQSDYRRAVAWSAGRWSDRAGAAFESTDQDV